jgi:DNA-directed RNA polymerase alpha subunit
LAQKIIPVAILFNPIAIQLITRIIYFVWNFIGEVSNMEKSFSEPLSISTQDWLNSLTLEECKELQGWLRKRVKYLNGIPFIKKKIEELNLSTRAYNALKLNNLHTVEDIVHLGLDNVWKIWNIGSKTVREIQQAVDQ